MTGEFKGDMSPQQTWDALSEDDSAVLVDVRTRAEWTYVGGPDLSELGKEVIQVEWLTFPTNQPNTNFLAELTAQVQPDQPVYLLCRSGVRSKAAAALLAQHGYTTYNIATGFEGPLNSDSHRLVSGWKADGLPWVQG